MHDGISWLMQSAMFLTLGLLIYPSQVWSVASQGVLISSFMIILARPISVFISLTFSGRSLREKLLISWVGLRGSVPVIMATYPLVAGIENAYLIFNLVFFVSLTSLILQGTSIPYVSKLLRVHDESEPKRSNYPAISGHLSEIVTVDVPRHSSAVNKTIVDLEIPLNKLLIIAIERRGEVIIPRGSTTIEAGDKVSLIADDDTLADFFELLWKKKHPRPGKKDQTYPPDSLPPDPNILIH